MGGGETRPSASDDVGAEVALLVDAQPWFDDRIHRRTVTGEAAPVVHHEVVADDRGGLAAMSLAVLPAPMNGAVRAAVVVAPGGRRAGTGSRLWRRAEPHLEGRAVMGSVRDDDQSSLAAVARWGFEPVQHSVGSYLEVGSGTPDPPGAPDVTVHRVDSWSPPAAVAQAWLDSDTSPEAEVFGPAGPDLYAGMFDAPVLLWLEEHGTPVAVIGCHRASGEEWTVVYTGTVPSARGRGFARLAKQHLHSIAARDGVVRVVTSNEEENVGIRALNASLGYRPTVGEVRVRREPSG
ncbi:MAG: GNAT family N-acetyltransferase [Candidatus Nanopelagicales bacterium]